jgi:hypothetical protein
MDKGISLPFFREAAVAIQGSAVLCSDPSLAATMAPHLPPAVLLQILSAQAPDDLCPIANNTAQFAAHFGLTDDDAAVISVSYTGDFAEVTAALPHDWDAKRFRADEAAGFDFLSEFIV